jgi:hypothetical protein
MKHLLFLSFFIGIICSSCYRQKLSLYRQEQDKSISTQLKQTSFSKLKLKTDTRIEFYALSKDTSGNFKVGFTIQEQKRHYFFIYLHLKLVHIWVSQDVADKKIKWKEGFYYFKDYDLVYKEEPESNFIDVEEVKSLAEEYLRKAKSL